MSGRPRINWVAMGQRAILFRFAEKADGDALDWSLAFAAEIEREPPEGMSDWIPAVTSLLVEWSEVLRDARSVAEGILERLNRVEKLPAAGFPLHEIPVRYDGPDLAEVARLHGMEPEEVARRHSQVEYRVYMLGFSPGFAYLGPLPRELHTPRRKEPRVRVPAGSVAIGGEHTAIYPQASPGGWNLIGSTDEVLFDPGVGREEAFRLKHGDRVKFVPL